MEVGGLGAGLTMVTHFCQTSNSAKIARRYEEILQGMEPSKTAEAASGHYPGAAAVADAIREQRTEADAIGEHQLRWMRSGSTS